MSCSPGLTLLIYQNAHFLPANWNHTWQWAAKHFILAEKIKYMPTLHVSTMLLRDKKGTSITEIDWQ